MKRKKPKGNPRKKTDQRKKRKKRPKKLLKEGTKI